MLHLSGIFLFSPRFSQFHSVKSFFAIDENLFLFFLVLQVKLFVVFVFLISFVS